MKPSKPYQALARKWRPQQFKDVLGQDHVTRTLANAIRLDRIGHAYLFTGPRGIGKTTLARILAKAINCAEGPTAEPCDKCSSCLGIIAGNSLDVIEIDGASNRGINEIRELRENVKFAPTSSRCKLYIIDEVHMLTKEAFNALLKTLEEPPPAVKFIFATTDPHKLPATIISRCQRFDLRKLSDGELVARFKAILEDEKREYEEEALGLLAGFAGGSMRDGESFLDQLLVYCDQKITAGDVVDLLGAVPVEVINSVSDSILAADPAGVLKTAENVFEKGWDLNQFIAALVSHFHNLLFSLLTGPPAAREDASEGPAEKSQGFSRPQLMFIINELLALESAVKEVISPRVAIEVTLAKLASAPRRVYVEDLIRRLEALEKKRPASNPSPAARPVAVQEDNPGNPTSPSPAPEAGLETVKNLWPDFLESLGTVRPRLKTYLSAGEPTEFKDGRLTVCFDEGHNFHRDELDSPAHRSVLERILKNKLGFPVKLEFTIAPLNQACSPEERQPSRQTKKKILKNHPLVREAMAAFDATIESIKE